MTTNSVLNDHWHDTYIAAARDCFPEVTKNEPLAVGWKITNIDGTTHNGYYWPLVNGDHDVPVLHTATKWDPKNSDSCPAREGDGLCLIGSPSGLNEATSGGVKFTSSIGHVLVYPTKLAKSRQPGKFRAPWVIDVDCFDFLGLARGGHIANLRGANLRGANLGGADLRGADLGGADLGGANLWGADLGGANLGSANLGSANLWGADLGGANLGSANLGGANLWGADLGGADLGGANLRGVVNASDARNVAQARNLDEALNVPAAWKAAG